MWEGRTASRRRIFRRAPLGARIGSHPRGLNVYSLSRRVNSGQLGYTVQTVIGNGLDRTHACE